jgi:hypothetical protein
VQRAADPATLYIAAGSDFQGIAARTLGNAGSSSDGFDAIIAVPLSTFSADVAALSELDAALFAMDFVEGAYSAVSFDYVVAGVDSIASDGAVLTGIFGALLG